MNADQKLLSAVLIKGLPVLPSERRPGTSKAAASASHDSERSTTDSDKVKDTNQLGQLLRSAGGRGAQGETLCLSGIG